MTLTKGSRVRFEDENDEPQIGTVLEYSDANDGTGKHVYWIEVGDGIYARDKKEVDPWTYPTKTTTDRPPSRVFSEEPA